MRAWVLEPPGGAASMRLLDVPVPSPGHVLVRVEAVALAADDALRPHGARGFIPGLDVAGRIIDVSAGLDEDQAAALVPDQRVVCHLPADRGGGFAEQVAVPVELMAQIPDELDPIAAAGLVGPGLTALDAVERRLRRVDHRRVLITGADTLVGLWCVELARLFDAHVIAMAHPINEAVVRRHGARHVIDASAPDLSAAIGLVVPGGVDDIIDTVGGAAATGALASLQQAGHVVSTADPSTADRSGLAALLRGPLVPTVSHVSLAAAHAHGREGSRWLTSGLERLMQLVIEGHLDPPDVEVIDFAGIPKGVARLDGQTEPVRLVANLRWDAPVR